MPHEHKTHAAFESVKCRKQASAKQHFLRNYSLFKQMRCRCICQMTGLIQRKKHIHIHHIIFPDKMADLRDTGIG